MDFVQRIFSLLMVLCAFFPASGALADHGISLGMSAAFTGPTRELGIEMYRARKPTSTP